MPVPKLFVVRVWQESSGEGKSVWRAAITNTRTGERKYFKHPGELVEFLQACLEATQTTG